MPKIVFAWFLAGCGLFLQNVARAQYPTYTLLTNTDAFKSSFAQASGKTSSIKSDFVQEKDMSVLSEKITSKGKFYFRREDNIRMEYVQPFSYLMILANKHVYIRDGQKENSVSTQSNKLFSQINRLVIDCVRGTAVNSPDFTVRIFEGGETYLVELTPVTKTLKDLFSTITVVLDKKDFTASKIRMSEPSGDYTLITFTNKERNVPLPDALFALH
jgi:outer membrane lipoprotein-sorting protein